MRAMQSVHAVHKDTFQLLKDAFPWRYGKSGNVEWVEVPYGDEGVITYYKKLP